MNATELQKIQNWLIDGAGLAASPHEMLAQACERFVQAGLPLWRVGVFIRTLHPEIFGRNFIWKPGEEVEVGTVDAEGNDTEIETHGRHDPCVGIRAVPVGEAMMACVLADHFLRHRGQVGG